jgi:sigma-B regulation protein RsbU (phosphoserine phosphatase)
VLAKHPQLTRWIYVLPLSALLGVPASMATLLLGKRLGVWAPWVAAAALGGAAALWWKGRRRTPAARPRGPTDDPIRSAAIALLLVVAVSAVAVALPRELPITRPLRIAAILVPIIYAALVICASFLGGSVGVLVAMIRSYRESGLEERQQIRWPIYAITGNVAAGLLLMALSGVLPHGRGIGAKQVMNWASDVIGAGLSLLIPLSFAIAILKHRLMDLELVVRKTAIYASVTVLLVVLYLALAGGLGGWIVQTLGIRSQWVTVFSTLGVAAAFVPVRNRVQTLVDRRFFRTRYQAGDALARLSRSVAETHDTVGIARVVAEELQRTFHARSVAVLEARGRTLLPAATLGLSDERVRELHAPLDGPAMRALLGRPTLPPTELPAPLQPAVKLLRAEAAAPVQLRGALRGLVLVGGKLSEDRYDEADLDFLAAAAGQFAAGLSGGQSPEQQLELDEARKIQAGLLPKSLPALPGVALAAHWQPALQVAGDYYDVLAWGAGRAGLCIADVTGKGMPAALLMSNLQATVKTFATELTEPAALCDRVNRIMAANLSPGRFITLFYGRLDTSARTLFYANAGHNPPLLLRADGRCERLEAGGLLLGSFPDARFEQAEIPLAPGDRLLLYTDGVTEAMNAQGELYGEERVVEVMRRHRAGTAEEMQAALLASVNQFCGGEFQDDATVLVAAVE